MTTDPTTRKIVIARWHRHLLLAASMMTCLLIIMGGIVCATESGAGCPDWPGCYGRIVPPLQAKPVIEYLHRFIAALTSPLIIAAAVVSWRKSRAIRWISRPPLVAIVFLVAVIVFGAFAVLTGLPPAIAAIDLGSALIVLALMLVSTVAAFARRATPDLPDRFSAGGSFARLNLAALTSVFVVYISGVLVAGKGSLTRCLGWPLWRLIPGDRPGWPQVVRLSIALVAALLIVAVVVEARRTQQKPVVRRVALTLGLAWVIEMSAGALMLVAGSSVFLLVIYVAAAAVLWALLVVSTALAGFAYAPQTRRAGARATFAAGGE
jgi:heme a synthase